MCKCQSGETLPLITFICKGIRIHSLPFPLHLFLKIILNGMWVDFYLFSSVSEHISPCDPPLVYFLLPVTGLYPFNEFFIIDLFLSMKSKPTSWGARGIFSTVECDPLLISCQTKVDLSFLYRTNLPGPQYLFNSRIRPSRRSSC